MISTKNAISALPELEGELLEAHGQLEVQIAVLSLAAEGAIKLGDLALLDRIAGLLNAAIGKIGSEGQLENSIRTMFLNYQELLATKTGRRALKRLPESLRHILRSQGRRPHIGKSEGNKSKNTCR